MSNYNLETKYDENGVQTVVRLKSYCPRIGLPVPEREFEICNNVPNPKIRDVPEGHCLIKNLYLSMDPAMRGWMTDMKGSYLPPLVLGSIMRGGSVGLVLCSKSNKIKQGDYVNCNPDAVGWAQYGISSDTQLTKITPREGIPVRAYAGILGGTGLTAYFGLLEIGKPQPGDVVLVSAAAGAVGSVVCQLAKHICGCRVVGIAGGTRKCEWLKSTLGIDESVDYKSKTFAQDLKRAVGPKGANVVFDNVGGEILDSMLKHLAKGARVVLCGAVSSMNDGPKPIANIMSLIVKSASMSGFTLFDYATRYDEAYENIANYLKEGKLNYAEDVVVGVENAPQALLKLFGVSGGNFGKLVVDLHPKDTTIATSKL